MPTIKLPQTGKSAQSATLSKWLKKAGDVVSKGDILLVVETEAGLVEIESPSAGKLQSILVEAHKTVATGTPLAVIEETAAPAAAAKPAPAAPAAPAKPAAAAPAGKVTPILMPKAGQSMEEGTIVKWRVEPGAIIKKGDVIFEVETDKATMEVEATDAGRLSKIIVGEGGTLAVLQPVAYLADNDADVDAFIAASGGAATPAASAESATEVRGEEGKTPVGIAAPAVSEGGRVKASPAARRIAADRGVDLASVATGSGPGGRILSTDVPAKGAAPAAPAATGTTRKKMSQMRKAIARNLLQSKQTIPHFYLKLTINAEPAVSFYQAEKAKYPCSINDVIILACAKAVQEFPAFRSRLEGEEVVTFAASNIGFAVGMDDGLVVPVVLGAERLKLQQVATETKRLAANAKGGKIEGMGQGVFTITNLGMFGTDEFAGIINPPEAAILAVGASRESIVVKDGAIKAGKVMTLTLSADHRIIDGMLAAKFMARLKEILESPAQSA